MELATDFRRQIRRVVVLPPLLFGIFLAVFFGLVVYLLSELDRMSRVDRLIARANAASRLLVNRETSLHRYLAEGSPDLLRAYREANARLGGCFDELARLGSDDPERSGRLARLRGQSEAWERYAGEAIELRARPAGSDRVPTGDAGAQGRMGEIRDSLAAFLDAEEGDRDRRIDATQSLAWAVLAGGTGAAIALGVLLAYSSRRHLGALRRAFESALVDLQSRSDRQERENLSLLSEAMRYYGIFSLDSEGRISSWNEGAERILGYRADEVLGRRPSSFYDQEDVKRDVLHRDLEWASLEGRVEDERWLNRKDGFRFKARVSLVAIRDANGDLSGYTHVVREIEDR